MYGLNSEVFSSGRSVCGSINGVFSSGRSMGGVCSCDRFGSITGGLSIVDF